MRQAMYPVRTSIALSKEVYDYVKAKSFTEKTSIGEQIRMLMDRALAEEKPKKKEEESHYK